MNGQKALSVNALIKRILEKKLGNKELMLYRHSDGTWSVDIGNPTTCVLLGEADGEYRALGKTMRAALVALLAQAEGPKHE